MRRSRVIAEIVATLAIPLAWARDASGVAIRRQRLAAKSIATVALAVLAATRYSRVIEHRINGGPEQQIDISILPHPMGTGEWHRASVDPHTRRLIAVQASFDIDIRNTDVVQRTVDELYLEFFVPRLRPTWLQALAPLRKRIAVLAPDHLDGDIDWCKRARPEVVDWQLPPSSATSRHQLYFTQMWNWRDVATPRIEASNYDLDLVIAVGGSRNRRRWRLASVDRDRLQHRPHQ